MSLVSLGNGGSNGWAVAAGYEFSLTQGRSVIRFRLKKGGKPTMKRSVLMVALALVIGLALYPIEGKAQMGSGMMRNGYGQGGGMGSGMMGGQGSGMGQGMMGPGYGYQQNPQYQQPEKQYQQLEKPLDEKGAKAILENYLKSTRNPNLKLGKIKDEGEAFEGDILTQNGSLVDKILVSKDTGAMRSSY